MKKIETESHGGVCSFCKSEINEQAVVCPNCDAWWGYKDGTYKRQDKYEEGLGHGKTIPLHSGIAIVSFVLGLIGSLGSVEVFGFLLFVTAFLLIFSIIPNITLQYLLIREAKSKKENIISWWKK